MRGTDSKQITLLPGKSGENGTIAPIMTTMKFSWDFILAKGIILSYHLWSHNYLILTGLLNEEYTCVV